MLKISQKDSCSALFQWRRPDFLFFLSSVISDISGRSGVDAPAGHSPNMLGLCPAGAISKALDDLFILCYTFPVKKEVPILLKTDELTFTIPLSLYQKMLNALPGSMFNFETDWKMVRKKANQSAKTWGEID